MYCRTSLKLLWLMVLSSTCLLISFRCVIYSRIFPMSCFLAASHEQSLTLICPPDFLVTTLGMIPARRHMVAANTSSSLGGGFNIPLQLLRSFWSSVSRADMAASTAGSALARSSSVSRCFCETSFWILATCSLSVWAWALSTSTEAFSFATTSAIPSAFSFLAAASSSITLRSSSSLATDSLVCRSLVRPFSSRSMAAAESLRFSSKREEYSLMSSR
mmetsp:Transcript_29593/g.86200  ORF Transcript_29593/g.86200 Transcript_29593/m.86200 type:complete len:218 (-) Transcript_29593:4602-5255(-)